MPRVVEFADCDQLSAEEFEVFVGEVFSGAGWTIDRHTKPGVDRPQGDGGVDLFARKDGRRFAIEVKQRSSATVGVDALNQLVTGAKLAGVSRPVLVTNSYFTREVESRALKLGVELFDRDRLQNLYVERTTEVGRRIRARGYQQRVIDEILGKFDEGIQAFLLEMATGLGKTYSSALICRAIADRIEQPSIRILFVAHRLEILKQSVTAYRNVLGIGKYSYSICNDGSPPLDTDIVFASVDTLYSRVAELESKHFDIVVVDEAHHSAAKTFATILDHFEPAFLLGLTATPIRADRKDIHRFFGGRPGHVGRLDLQWALRNRKLAFPKYKVLLDDLDLDAVASVAEGLHLGDLNKRLFLHRRDEEVVDIIERTIVEEDIQRPKAIVFCRSVDHIRHLLPFFPPGSATMVYGKMGKMDGATRQENIEGFRSGTHRYILVCDLFNEGVDIPETNILVFLRSTASRTIWLQQLGRGLRKTANKDHVHVLDFVGSIDRIRAVRDLQKEVEARPAEIHRDWDEEGDRPDVYHDACIEVSFSKNAADVLRLIDTFEMRLCSDMEVVEAIRELASGRPDRTLSPAVYESIPDIAASQILTHFGSWSAAVSAALGMSETQKVALQTTIRELGVSCLDSDGVMPTDRRLSLLSEVDRLPLVTAQEIIKLFGSIANLEAQLGVVPSPEKPEPGASGWDDLLEHRRRSRARS
jgi:superfamily II DNA or RNA helicase